MLEFFKTNLFLSIILFINIILFIMVIISMIRIRNINKNTETFLKKLGNGQNIKVDLEKYMNKVSNLEKAINENKIYCNKLEKKIEGCVQKIGIIRYNAYKDAGKDLSFAVALLDDKNNGVVFNGIYSREMSSIYAKPIENGQSKYSITEEENKALIKAMKE